MSKERLKELIEINIACLEIMRDNEFKYNSELTDEENEANKNVCRGLNAGIDMQKNTLKISTTEQEEQNKIEPIEKPYNPYFEFVVEKLNEVIDHINKE